MKLSFAAGLVALSLSAAPALAQQTPPAQGSTPPPADGVAAATLPNAFGGPQGDRPAPPPAAPTATPAAVADPRAEPALRTVIDSVAAGAPLDYAVFTPDAGTKMREMEDELTGLVAGKGEIVAVLFQGKHDGADVFRVVFETGADTQWAVGLDAGGKVAFFLFREAAD